MKRFFVWLTLLFVLGATGAIADDKRGSITNPKQLPDSITVTANRQTTPIKQVASSITIITEDDIAASQNEMVSDILRRVPGIDIVQSGGIGKTVSVFMRGAGSHHTLVIVDGIEMNDPGTASSSFDFAHLKANDIARIEILRGPQSVLYGSDAIGGVINIITKKGIGKPKIELNAEAGSYKSYNESIRLSGSENKIDYAIAYSRKDSDGFNSIKTANPDPENDGYNNNYLSASLGWQLSENLFLEMFGKVIDAEADIDKSSFNSDDPNFITKSNVKSFAANLNLSPANSMIKQTYGVAFSKHKSESIDRFDQVIVDEDSEFITYGERLKFELKNIFEISKDFSLLAGVETEDEKFSSEAYSINPFFSYGDTVLNTDNRTTGLYLMSSFNFDEKMFITAGIRNDHHGVFGNEVTYRATSTFLPTDGPLKLKATVGSGFKAPSLFQLKHQLYGNPDLLAETSFGWELGFETNLNKLILGVTYFANDYKELISYNSATFKNENIAKAEANGWELFVDYNFNEKTLIHVDYTMTDAIDKISNLPLIRRPKHKASLSATSKVTDRLQGSFNILMVGDRDDLDFSTFPSETVTLLSYTRVDMAASFSLTEQFKLKGRVDNIFDKEYEEVLTYNSPKRSGYIGFSYSL